jgi:biuret amidohydrolase
MKRRSRDDVNKSDKVLPSSLLSRWYNADDYSSEDRWKGFDPAGSALVLIDLINWQAHPQGASIQSIRNAGAHHHADYLTQRCSEILLPNLQAVLRAARAAGVQVIHARLASRHPSYRDIVPALQPYVRAAAAMDGTWETEVLTELGKDPRDLSVVKTGSGAFTGSGLDLLLRRFSISTVLYAGVVTNACVMLTVAAGFDLGYRQYLITDCTGALNGQDQADAERFIGLYLAELVSASEAVSALDARARA